MSSIPGCLVSWKIDPEGIAKKTEALVVRSRNVYDEISAVKDITFENVALKLALFEAEYQSGRNMLDFLQHVSPDRDIRDASYTSNKILSDVEVGLGMRKDVFEKFVDLKPKLDEKVSPEMKRYVDYKIAIGKRNGLHLDEATRQTIEALSKEEARLSIDFRRNLNEENTILDFTEQELDGCPPDLLKSLVRNSEGKLLLTLKYPHYFPCSQRAKNPATRQRLEHAFNSRCTKENTPILDRLLEVRQKRARLLGFKTHSDYALELRMAKNAATVEAFLSKLQHRLKPILAKDMDRVLELKKDECEKNGFVYSGKLEPWDLSYYMNMIKEIDFAVDHEALKKYFPLNVVKTGILKLYQHLLGLKFSQVQTEDVWHPDVEMYRVSNIDDSLVGYFYMDLHSRPSKYGHAAVFGLQPGCLRSSSSAAGEGNSGIERQVAIGALVTNFTSAVSDDYSSVFLLHEEVDTFFHEFGHVMHRLCARAETVMFSGTHVERDFVECPSQMLENWVWSAEGLHELLSTGGGEILPKDVVDKLVSSRIANAGLFYSRQVLLASFDQAIHTSNEKVDIASLFAKLCKEIMNIESSPGTNMPASFDHLAGGYDAQYYGYLWSEVFSADLFDTRFRCASDGGCLSPTVGREYREKILAPGGSKDAIDMIRDFLGRDPSESAFLKQIGLKCDEEA